ncbi:FAD-dependent oxidoreductase [Hyphomicrobiales bacterium]|nr:FAD-dependent oxidoreductase [Bosea sp. (in: a-proteobacteria)]CAH1696450.1 FAD-dependent oxidoreductase [Hyphomicrobiales bacterium]CAH1696467.1 FAD-dependent oxidoreductase [Hyphomicrobiales bacterium]
MAGDKSINTVSLGMGLEIFGEDEGRERRARPALTYREAAREIPVFSETDVLVVGGGPAGTSAAVAAARLGADVTLVERYNHLGGLSTGGLVLWIDRMTDWNGTQVIAGFARELFDRLPKDAVMGPPRAEWGSRDAATADYWSYRSAAFQNIVTWSPTIDPEALKTLSMRLMVENKIRLVLHAWAVQPIVEDGVVRGAIFESKEGRHAILAKVVIDTTGDADLLARAGVGADSDIDTTDIHHCINTAFMLGGVDMERWTEFRRTNKAGFSDFMKRGREKLKYFEKPFFSWRPDIGLFMGPRLSGYSAVNVEDLTEVEIKSRQLAVAHLESYRAEAPGFENAYLLLGAPQVGVRHSRRFAADRMVTRAQWDEAKVWDDEIGVSTSLAPKWANVSVPYGSLLPTGLDGALGAGRHVACDASSHTFLREIPQCWMTGQAAGVAGALAANAGVAPRELDVRLLQRELLKQGAYLSGSVVEAANNKAETAAA